MKRVLGIGLLLALFSISLLAAKSSQVLCCLRTFELETFSYQKDIAS